jgi:hypothetical protein
VLAIFSIFFLESFLESFFGKFLSGKRRKIFLFFFGKFFWKVYFTFTKKYGCFPFFFWKVFSGKFISHSPKSTVDPLTDGALIERQIMWSYHDDHNNDTIASHTVYDSTIHHYWIWIWFDIISYDMQWGRSRIEIII